MSIRKTGIRVPLSGAANNNNWFWALILAVAVALALAGCGGGGGGGDTPQQAVQQNPPTEKALSFKEGGVKSGCDLVDRIACDLILQIVQTGLAGSDVLKVTGSNGESLTAKIGDGQVLIPVKLIGTTTYTGEAAGLKTVISITVVCGPGLEENATKTACQLATIRYTSTWFVLRSGAYPELWWLDMATGKAVAVTNATKFGKDFFNFAIGPKMADGRVLVQGSIFGTADIAYATIDPSAADKSLTLYTGAVASGTVFSRLGPKGPHFPVRGTEVTSEEGITCFVDGTDIWSVQCQDAAGKPSVTFKGTDKDGNPIQIFVVKN